MEFSEKSDQVIVVLNFTDHILQASVVTTDFQTQDRIFSSKTSNENQTNN